MGKRIKYFSEEDKIKARRARQKRYYQRNRDKMKSERLQRLKDIKEGKREVQFQRVPKQIFWGFGKNEGGLLEGIDQDQRIEYDEFGHPKKN